MEESRLCVYRQIVFHIWVTNSQLRGLAGMEKAEKQKSTNHEARERKISYFFSFFFFGKLELLLRFSAHINFPLATQPQMSYAWLSSPPPERLQIDEISIALSRVDLSCSLLSLSREFCQIQFRDLVISCVLVLDTL